MNHRHHISTSSYVTALFHKARVNRSTELKSQLVPFLFNIECGITLKVFKVTDVHWTNFRRIPVTANQRHNVTNVSKATLF